MNRKMWALAVVVGVLVIGTVLYYALPGYLVQNKTVTPTQYSTSTLSSGASSLYFITPQANTQIAIGDQYVIQWNQAASTSGALYLQDADDNNGAGWIAGYIAPGEKEFTWDTASALTLSRSPGLTIPIKPGKYFIELLFDGPNSQATSGVFTLTAP